MSETWNVSPSPSPVVLEKPAAGPEPARKGFPKFAIPAIIMLCLMLLLFFLELFLSMHKVNVIRIFEGNFVGLDNYGRYASRGQFGAALGTTLLFRAVQLGVSGILAAGLCALYFAMKNPRVALTFACLWLIPACLPYLTGNLLFISTIRTDSSGTVLYLLSGILQTVSLFCFFGGLFTWLNLVKKGKAGGGPFYGLLVGILAWLLGGLTTGPATVGMNTAFGGTTLDMLNLRMMVQNMQLGFSSAGSVLKVLVQILLAVAPMIVLCLLARKKSSRGKTPLTVLWVFLAVPTGILLLLLGLDRLATDDRFLNSSFVTLLVVLIGGAFGGLLAYSFLHLLRRVPAFLFGVFAVVLAASLSCISSQYIVLSRFLGLQNTIWPQVLLSAFDGRLVLIVTVLAFALRNYQEARPGSLVIAMALLTGAFLWGEINIAYAYSSARYSTSLSLLALQISQTATSAASVSADSAETAAAAAAARNAIRTESQLLVALPPLVLGAGAALMLKRGLAGPKSLVRE